MKAFTSVISTFLESRTSRQNLMTLVKLLAVFAGLVALFSILFHVLMEREGQHHTWITGFYWTLTVMSTLGFGDITFHTDLGRMFSLLVLVTGVVFLLVLLPFTFIEFFYAPWIKAQAAAESPRSLPPETERHVILTVNGPVNRILTRMLRKHGFPYFVLVPTLAEALEMRERNHPVVLGDLSDPETYQRIRADRAALLLTTRSDIINTNVTFSVRDVTEDLPVIASARSSAARDALELAGVTHVLSLEEMMGQALSRRVVHADSRAQVIGKLDQLVIAEARGGADLVGRTLADCGLRAATGVTIVGLWKRGKLIAPEPQSRIEEHTMLILSGTAAQIEAYNEIHARPHQDDAVTPAVLIVGGGRVGRATAAALAEREIPWTMIEKLAERVRYPDRTYVGDASEFELLVKAGLHEAASVIVTTHDDDTNLFLTIFLRKLRPRTQIICRCTHEANVERLHRAGADLVMSYASMSANAVFNHLKDGDTLLLAEGVSVFTAPVPRVLADRPLSESSIRNDTGCSLVAIDANGTRTMDLSPQTLLPADGTLVLIGSLEAEERFHRVYPS